MPTTAQFNGITTNNIRRINGIKNAHIQKINGIIWTPSFLPFYSHYKDINVNGSIDGALAAYQVTHTIINTAGADAAGTTYTNGRCLANFNDIRFLAADKQTVLNHFLESISGNTAIVVIKMPVIPASPSAATIYMLYGYAGASAYSNGVNTWDLFDDFLGATLDDTKWTEAGVGTHSVGSSILTVPQRSWVGSISTFAKPCRFRSLVNYPLATSAAYWTGVGFNQTAPSTTPGASDNEQMRFMTVNSGAKLTTRVPPNESNSDVASWAGSYKIFELLWSTNSAIFNVAGASLGTLTTNVPTAAQRATFLNHPAGNSGISILVDWVAVGNYTVNEPTWSTAGAEKEL